MDPNKWTDLTVKIFKAAEQLAFTYKNAYITPMHLMNAIIAEPGNIAIHAMQMCGADIDKCKNEFLNELKTIPIQNPPPVELGLHPSSQRVLRHAMELQQSMKDSYLAIDHLLLSLIEEKIFPK